MSVYTDLCDQPLKPGEGVPMGIPGYPTMRFAVQVATVTVGNLLGTFILGQGILGGPRWHEMTQDCEGVHWNRGGQPAQRPMAGELTFRLNNQSGRWSPWQSPFFAPGTMVRAVVGNETTIIPQFCGQTTVWNEAGAGLHAYEWVEVTVWENMFLLSEVNDHALDGVIGGGDTLTQRIDRLLTQAAWQFGRDIASTVPATFQASNFPSDVATELYKTVDSVECVVWPAKDGELMIRDRAVGSGNSWTLNRYDQNPDTLVTANDDERILSSVDLARVGGTAVTYTGTGIAARYQRRSTQRTDLMTVAEPGNADLARVANGMLNRGKQTYRPVTISGESGQGVNPSKLIVEADITDRINLVTTLADHSRLEFANYSICGMSIDVTVAAAGTYWRGTITMDIEVDSGWSVKPPAYAKWGVSHWDGSERWL